MTETGEVQRATAPVRYPRRTALIAAAGVAALIITAVVAFRWGTAGGNGSASALPASSAGSTSSSEPLSTADIYTTLLPSMVAIDSVRPDSATTTPEPAPGSPTDGPPVVTASTGSSGTGVIANADGSILTALHVVDGATAIQVTFADGPRSAAVIAAADPTIDMAVLTAEILPSVVVPAVLGNSAALAVGDDVIAIGNPLGLTDTTTTGVVSGLGRSANRVGGPELSGLIQFDAAVNEGSSGGPLVNAKGETVGIVVALANPTDAKTFIGIGFAVPIATAVAAGGGGPEK